jgi:cytidyltransferase-like protein
LPAAGTDDVADAPPVWVYVDVVFDLFHSGHVEFLRQSRAFGDKLVVGLVSDDDVASYKPRPIMTLEERAAIVSACRYVDRVIPNAPLHCTRGFLDNIGAAFVCHGDDFTPEQLDYWYGDLKGTGRLKVVPYTRGVSSREIISRIADRLRDGSLRIQL